MDDWKTIRLPFGKTPIFRGELAVSFREGNYNIINSFLISLYITIIAPNLGSVTGFFWEASQVVTYDQIMAKSHDLGPQKVAFWKGHLLFHRNLGW